MGGGGLNCKVIREFYYKENKSIQKPRHSIGKQQ